MCCYWNGSRTYWANHRQGQDSAGLVCLSEFDNACFLAHEFQSCSHIQECLSIFISAKRRSCAFAKCMLMVSVEFTDEHGRFFYFFVMECSKNLRSYLISLDLNLVRSGVSVCKRYHVVTRSLQPCGDLACARTTIMCAQLMFNFITRWPNSDLFISNQHCAYKIEFKFHCTNIILYCVVSKCRDPSFHNICFNVRQQTIKLITSFERACNVTLTSDNIQIQYTLTQSSIVQEKRNVISNLTLDIPSLSVD